MTSTSSCDFNWPDIRRRALKTAGQAAIAAVPVGSVTMNTAPSDLRIVAITALMAGVAGGVSVLWNAALRWAQCRA